LNLQRRIDELLFGIICRIVAKGEVFSYMQRF